MYGVVKGKIMDEKLTYIYEMFKDAKCELNYNTLFGISRAHKFDFTPIAEA